MKTEKRRGRDVMFLEPGDRVMVGDPWTPQAVKVWMEIKADDGGRCRVTLTSEQLEITPAAGNIVHIENPAGQDALKAARLHGSAALAAAVDVEGWQDDAERLKEAAEAALIELNRPKDSEPRMAATILATALNAIEKAG